MSVSNKRNFINDTGSSILEGNGTFSLKIADDIDDSQTLAIAFYDVNQNLVTPTLGNVSVKCFDSLGIPHPPKLGSADFLASDVNIDGAKFDKPSWIMDVSKAEITLSDIEGANYCMALLRGK
ncbi:hypothetical protein NVP1049O_41 [Vibrio phage 1.049.O._10N.286.54.B5]|nr:hypothetical protein NVP1049O_41 [Vibrio phage 1.049.O._10N.286.54.B5]AUR84210.1 hypothetical protein NVP1050O_41 [Vibrio phage 1.050.O._10N.286.48.A6]